MQTYGQNRTPQQQMFNHFPQRFQQPQPVAQPAQGPVYADQSLNAPGNQLQQFQQPQYGRFGRGFMPQNRGGYERQMDQLRGGYNRPMPSMMPQQGMEQATAYNTYMQSLPEYSQQQDLQKQMAALSAKMEADPQGTTMRNALQSTQQMPYSSPASVRPGMGYGGDYGRFNMDRGQQQMPLYNGPTQAQWDQMKSQPATGYESAPSLGGQAPAGGKGGNPTAQLPPPLKQDGTPGSWSTYI
jgi:hypothetical protein